MNIGQAIEETITGSQDTATEFRKWCKAMLAVTFVIAVFQAVGTFLNYRSNHHKAK
ncbi:MAG: hypothetical protein HYR91_06220 [Flavobacteriia bacterium]|nr:hypothetical protein [Flavobacteriia bacterium]